jgi:hypothetical protein
VTAEDRLDHAMAALSAILVRAEGIGRLATAGHQWNFNRRGRQARSQK